METAVVPVEARAVASVYGTDNPTEIVQRTEAVAIALGTAIKRGHMSTSIQGREYVLAEGWAYLGSMLGVFPRTVRVEPMGESADPDGYEAHVELVTRDGSVVGGAIAECSRLEKSWADRAPYALKSMAQTRATGKAYRMAFGYVMRAAGYEATPAEEMSQDNDAPRRQRNAGIANRGAFLTAMHDEFGWDARKTLDYFGCEDVAQLDEVMAPFESWANLAAQVRENEAVQA